MQEDACQSVKVAVRIRPMTVRETLDNSSECLLCVPHSSQLVLGLPDSGQTQKSFTFDHVFEQNSEQSQVYESLVVPLLEEFLKGFNATILAYGQTGSGKTFSMGTGFNEEVSQENRGLVPRAIEALFAALEQEKANDPEFEFTTTVSFLELYNEDLVDLLGPREIKMGALQSGPTIREIGGKIVWSGIKEEHVASPKELFEFLRRGSLCRTTGATDMNAVSSRSHAIFSVTLSQNKMTYSELMSNDLNSAETVAEEQNGLRTRLVSKFHFVDLAGSERLKKTNAEGDRKKEGISINQGLLALGNVISALGDESRKTGHVPYRDSKLTRMLQDSLGGNSKTLMLACVSPSDANYSETLSTLHYANRAKNIKNKVSINEDFSSAANNAEIRSLRALVLQLRTELAMLRPEGTSTFYNRLHDDLQVLPTNEPRFQIQREKDLMREVQVKNHEVEAAKIEHDRLVFVCNRLAERNNSLTGEVMQALIERDEAILSKCKAISTTWSPVSKHAVTEEPSKVSADAPRQIFSESNIQTVKSLLRGYNLSIRELRTRLSEAQDQVGWCTDFFSRMGKGAMQAALSPEALKKMLLPTNARIESLRNDDGEDFLHEKEYIQAVRENPQLHDFLAKDDDPSFGGDVEPPLRLFGLPKIASAANIPSSLRLQSESCDEDEPVHIDEYSPANDTDMYLLMHKIQTDISEHEALMGRILRRDAEYDMMKKSYEQKMDSLHHQLHSTLKERDKALKLLKDPLKNKKEAHQALAISTNYEEKKKRLEVQLCDYRKKLEGSTRHYHENKSRNEALTKDLKAIIESMKAEKSKILRQLRKETQSKLEITTTSQREVAKWKRKGSIASDRAQKLERSYELQRMLLKRKNDEHVKSQQKLRHVMSLLKRSSTPSKIRKLNACYVPSPSKKLSRVHINKSHRAADAPLHKGRTYSRSFLTERSVPDANIFKVDSRARLKYDLLQKEIANCIATKQSLNVVKCLLSQSKRLLGEQHELLAERSRIVTADYENTGVYDPETPQYMDERLGYLEYELSAIDSKIRVVQEHLVRSGAITDAFAFEGALELNQDPFFEVDGVDVTWENCINLLLSLNRKELDDVSVMILEDFVSVRIEADDGKAVLEERTKSIADLKVLIDQYKTAELDKELSINALEGEQVAESLETAQPSAEASKALSPKRTRSTRVSEEFGDHLNTNPLLFPTRSSPMSHESRSFSAASLKTLSGSTGPSTNDVFERLASAHTLASQAKVIPKLTMFVEKTLPDVTS